MYALVNRDFVFVLKKRRQGNDIYHHNMNEAHPNQEPPIENYIERDFNSIDAINIDEEQKEAIYDEEGSSGSRELPPIFIPFRNFRRNQMVPGPNLPAQHMPQLSSNRRSGMRCSISYENDVYKVIYHSHSNIKHCVICLELLAKNNQEIAKVKCRGKHTFHRTCIDQWYALNGT